jgi:hypothetical protein
MPTYLREPSAITCAAKTSMIATAIGSNTTARPAFEPSVVSLLYGGETCLATAPLAQSAHPTQPSFLLQTLDGSGSYRSHCWTASHGAANTTSFSNWTTGFSRTSAYREQSLGKLDGLISQVGVTNRILSIPVGERPTPARAKAARLLVSADQTAAKLAKV